MTGQAKPKKSTMTHSVRTKKENVILKNIASDFFQLNFELRKGIIRFSKNTSLFKVNLIIYI